MDTKIPLKRSLLSRLPFDAHTLRLLFIAVGFFTLFSVLLPGKFFTIRNMQSMAVQFPEFGILAFAIMITMLTGGIDLSPEDATVIGFDPPDAGQDRPVHALASLCG